MLLKPRRIPNPGLLPFVFFYLLNSIYLDVKKVFSEGDTNTSFFEWYWSQINMVKMIPTVLGSLKRSTKFCYWILFGCRGHFFLQYLWNIALHIWLLLHDCVLAKVPKTRLHIHKMRQRPIPSIQITKFHEKLNSTLFTFEAVARNSAITLISPHLKTMPKESTGKHHKRLLLKRCKINFFDPKLASNITFFLSHGMSEAVVDAKFWPWHKKLCIFWAVNKHNTIHILFPVQRHEGNNMMSHYLGSALTPCFVTMMVTVIYGW